MFLDDDSDLDVCFLSQLEQEIKSSEPIINVPDIMVNGDLIYPSKIENGLAYSMSSTSIMSGLCISSKALYKIKDKYSDFFDSRYSLYGLDKTLFFRLISTFGLFNVSRVGTIYQSLPSHEIE